MQNMTMQGTGQDAVLKGCRRGRMQDRSDSVDLWGEEGWWRRERGGGDGR